MRFSLIHLDDAGRSDEVHVLVPGVEKTLFATPLAVLAEFLPLLAEASADLPEARCSACGGDPLGREASAHA
jgi:hypothetical protein